MASSKGPSARDVQQLIRLFLQLPPWLRVASAVVVVVVLLVVLALYLRTRPTPAVSDPGEGTYTFCFWNVENLFDDQDDGRKGAGDNVFDPWLARDPEARQKKLERLCDVLLSDELNGGKGPDILAMCEVESERAVELLQSALNARLKDPSLHYGARAWAGPGAGRHIGPALLARLPIEGTRLLRKQQRTLEARITASERPLTVIASHWTSRISDKTGDSRARYAEVIYERFGQMYEANAAVPVLICGDFNDDPNDASLTDHLHATGDRDAVRGASPPKLFNPFAALFEQGQLTHAHQSKGHVFDHICLSPGLLGEKGWAYVPGSARIVPKFAERGRPNRFGNRSDRRPWERRGASDHFPVTVQLRVNKEG